jgi:hypothetical protein
MTIERYVQCKVIVCLVFVHTEYVSIYDHKSTLGREKLHNSYNTVYIIEKRN